MIGGMLGKYRRRGKDKFDIFIFYVIDSQAIDFDFWNKFFE
jgi:hypothetical protein